MSETVCCEHCILTSIGNNSIPSIEVVLNRLFYYQQLFNFFVKYSGHLETFFDCIALHDELTFTPGKQNFEESIEGTLNLFPLCMHYTEKFYVCENQLLSLGNKIKYFLCQKRRDPEKDLLPIGNIEMKFVDQVGALQRHWKTNAFDFMSSMMDFLQEQKKPFSDEKATELFTLLIEAKFVYLLFCMTWVGFHKEPHDVFDLTKVCLIYACCTKHPKRTNSWIPVTKYLSFLLIQDKLSGYITELFPNENFRISANQPTILTHNQTQYLAAISRLFQRTLFPAFSVDFSNCCIESKNWKSDIRMDLSRICATAMKPLHRPYKGPPKKGRK